MRGGWGPTQHPCALRSCCHCRACMRHGVGTRTQSMHATRGGSTHAAHACDTGREHARRACMRHGVGARTQSMHATRGGSTHAEHACDTGWEHLLFTKHLYRAGMARDGATAVNRQLRLVSYYHMHAPPATYLPPNQLSMNEYGSDWGSVGVSGVGTHTALHRDTHWPTQHYTVIPTGLHSTTP